MQEKRSEQGNLEWRDLLYLHHENIVLRFNSETRAQVEIKSGGRGDFVSLATFGADVIEERQDDLDCATVQHGVLKNLYRDIIIHNSLTDDQKNALIERMQACILHHIKRGCLFTEDKGKPALLLGIHDEAKFPPVIEGGKIDTGYPLGKFETHDFPAERVKELICVLEFDSSKEDMAKRLFANLIKTIKSLSEQYWNNPAMIQKREKTLEQQKKYYYIEMVRTLHSQGKPIPAYKEVFPLSDKQIQKINKAFLRQAKMTYYLLAITSFFQRKPIPRYEDIFPSSLFSPKQKIKASKAAQSTDVKKSILEQEQKDDNEKHRRGSFSKK